MKLFDLFVSYIIKVVVGAMSPQKRKKWANIMAETMNGKFIIQSVQFPKYALNVYGTSAASRKNICLYPVNASDPMQQWIPQAQGNNVYKLSTAQIGSCKVVLDHFREVPIDNCDVYTSASSKNDGTPTIDLLDQQLLFVKGWDGTYTIYLYDSGKNDKVLTCAAAVDNSGVDIPSSLTETDNVYWAEPDSSLERRQKWTITWLDAKSTDTILPCAQAYVQRDNTWAYLTNPGEFDELACGVCSLTTCGAIIKKDNSITPKVCRDDGGFVYGNVTTQWYVYGIDSTKLYSGQPTEAYKRIYEEINKGNPVVVRVAKPTCDHFVTAYGYTFGTTENNITPSRILIIDPYNPEYTNLQELLNESSFEYIYVREQKSN